MNVDTSNKLLRTLQDRFEKHMQRHKGVAWKDVQAKLSVTEAAMISLAEMERTGGETDVIGYDKKTGQYIFCDCAAESPLGRRGLCFDRKALDSRKENKPKGCALDIATATGVELLTEMQYRELQELEQFDAKTSSWIATPEDVRSLGGALFCDRRYGKVFVYHNGAESYYAARGFRAMLRLSAYYSLLAEAIKIVSQCPCAVNNKLPEGTHRFDRIRANIQTFGLDHSFS
jgi:Protein of unknown function (DUF4256)